MKSEDNHVCYSFFILAVLTNLQKINSLPVEVQALSSNGDLDVTIPIEKVDKPDIISNINGHSGIVLSHMPQN